MLQLFQIIWLTFCTTMVTASVTYGDLLDNIITGKISTYGNQSASIEYSIEAPHGADLDISMVSLNNGQVVKDAIQVYKYALVGNKWGDAKLLSLFIQYNGQAFDYANSEDILMDLVNDADGNSTQIEVWKNTTTSTRLVDLYDKVYANVDNGNLHRRNGTKCDNNHVPKQGDCKNLDNWLQVNGWSIVETAPSSYCWGSCCISWSLEADFNYAWAAGKLEWCMLHCTNVGTSCEIQSVPNSSKSYNFCVSNKGNGCE